MLTKLCRDVPLERLYDSIREFCMRCDRTKFQISLRLLNAAVHDDEAKVITTVLVSHIAHTTESSPTKRDQHSHVHDSRGLPKVTPPSALYPPIL